VVIGVALTLAGLLFPAMAQVKENAHRVVCSSNLRQIGIAVQLYADNNGGSLPYSSYLTTMPPQKQELMSASSGKSQSGDQQWDGLGLLFAQGFCSAPDCFYCPSHHGEHPLTRYRDAWLGETEQNSAIYMNYHYAGHKEWNLNRIRRLDDPRPGLAMATDGLATKEDFNHRVGMNVLAFDGSVRWRDDRNNVYDVLPNAHLSVDSTAYPDVWPIIEQNPFSR
jgi:hypothetical protein